MSRASVDPSNPAIIEFDSPVTLQEAIQHLWGASPPGYREPLRPIPGEFSQGGRQRRFLIDIDSPGLLMSIRDTSVCNFYSRRLNRPILSTGEPSLPEWVPESVRQRILSGDLRNGVTRFQAPRPWAGLVVWYARERVVDAQVYLEFPEDLAFYRTLTGGDADLARRLHHVYGQFNRDMRYFVEDCGYSPNRARDEIRRINDECFRMILEMSATFLAAGAGLAPVIRVMRSNARQMAAPVRSPARSGTPRSTTTAMTREGLDGIFQRAATRQQPEVPENVYLGREGRREYTRAWRDYGGEGDSPRYGFEVRDHRGRVIRRIGHQAPDDANAAVQRRPFVGDQIGVSPPSQTTAGVRGTRLEEIDHPRFIELQELLRYHREPGRIVRASGRNHPDYLGQWVAAGGDGLPPADGFAVWAEQLDEVLQVVVPYHR